MIVIQVTQENSHKEITSKQLQLKSSSQNYFFCICANNNNNKLIDFALSHAYGILTVGQI